MAASASPLAVVFTGADDVGLSAPAYDASGQLVDIALGFAPATGTQLTVVENTGLGFIQGGFTNLAHGQSVNLEYAGKPFRYVADYFGGDGNDLVLRWAASRPLAWGTNDKGQLGDGSTASATLATAVSTSGVLAGKTILALAAGGSHSLVLCADGTLATWGANNNGQLGNNSSMASSPVPVRVQQTGVLAGRTVVAIAAGEDHNLALCSDGTVAAWGGNLFGKLGDGGVSDRRFPVAVNTSGVLAGKSVVRIAAGRHHSLAICSDGTVVAWGRNTAGQLGNGETLHTNLLPVAIDQSGVLAGKQVVALAGGEFFTLALCSDGTLASWGNNNSGQLGNGSVVSSTVPALVDQSSMLAGRSVVEIAVGSSHALARSEDGLIAAWGYNSYGQLGDGTTSGWTQPTAVNRTGVLAGRMPRNLGTGSMASLALARDGTLAMWGGGQSVPTEAVTAHLPEGERFCGVGSGSSASHTIGLVAMPYAPRMYVDHPDLRVRLDDDATMDFGAVPPGGQVVRSLNIRNDGIEPLAITHVGLTGAHAGDFSAGAPPVSPIAPGGSAALPVTFTAGDGFHRHATLRIESDDPFRDVFEIDLSATVTGTLAVSLVDPAVPALSAKAITVTGSTILPMLAAQPAVGSAFMLLENTGGEFITGSFNNLTHGQITELDHAGTSYQFIVNYHGGNGNDLVLQWAATRPLGWGSNFAGQLHAGLQEFVDEPTAIPTSGLLAGRSILFATSSFGFSIVLCADGSIIGWGANNAGQLGNGGTAATSPPVEVNRSGVMAGRTVVALSAGYEHCLALCADGGMAAWGKGYGSLPVVVAPGAAMNGKRVVAIGAGSDHNLALCSDGSVFQWPVSASAQPVEVHRLRTLRNRAVDAISAGNGFSLALCSDGTLVSWGSNIWGKLGIGEWGYPPADEPLPVDSSGVLAGKTVRAISAGGNHAIALCDDGTLATWGASFYGELGNGLSDNSSSPVAVDRTGTLAGRMPVSVAAAYQYCVVGLADGGVAAWGEGNNGALGNGVFRAASMPVEVFTRSLATGERLLAPAPGSYSIHNLALVALPHLPRLAVGHGSGMRVANGRFTADLGSTPAGGHLDSTFTLRNDGIEPLAIDNVTIDGRDAADFAVITPPPSVIAAGASADLVIRFTAGIGFAREAKLRILSNDPDNGVFEIGLAATASGVLTAAYPDGAAVPLSAIALTATGCAVNLVLAHLPATGAELTLVEITGMDFITGRFDNLQQGQEVVLEFGGKTFRFVANYYGGSGNDLVLQWAAVRPFCWGLNSSGQLGDGTSVTRFPPGPALAGVLASRSPVALAARANHTLALCADGGLAAWGNNSSGQFGRGTTTSSDVPIAAGTAGALAGRSVAAIATGSNHALALCTDGTLAAWGGGSAGQLGSGSTGTSTLPVEVDQTGVLMGRRVVAIAAGNSHNLALCSDGTIAAWGANLNGELGDMTSRNRSLPVEVTASGLLAGRRVVAIAAGASHSLALCEDGTIAAWGSNAYGKLGAGEMENSLVPVQVDRTGVLASKTVVGIAAGEHFSLALCDDGMIAAWGDNSGSQLGDGGTASSPVPVVVAMEGALGGRIARQLAAGRSHSLAQGSPGAPAAWGNNFNGRLGDGTNFARAQPIAVSTANLLLGETFVQSALTQGNDHSVALVALPYIPRIVIEQPPGQRLGVSDAAVFFEPKGTGATTTKTFNLRNSGIVPLELSEVEITGPHAGDFQITTAPPAVVEPGATATLAITFTAGAGFQRAAELLVASNDPYAPDFRVSLESSGSGMLVASYATGGEVPLRVSSLHPAGSTVSLSLAHEPPTGAALMLVDMTGPGFIHGAFDNLAPGQEVALDFNGRCYRFTANYYGGSGNDLVLEWSAVRPSAWGRNSSGQLGTGDTLARSLPADIITNGVLAGKHITALAAGATHSLALCADGTLAAWGSNSSGRLGNGSTQSSTTPVLVDRSGVLSGKTVVSIAVGSGHSLALCSDGSVSAWGIGSNGRLGNGLSISSSLPVAVTSTGALAGKSVVDIAAGDQHSLALCSDGTVVSWGGNSAGQIGNGGDSRGSAVPVAVHTAGVLAGKSVVAIAAGVSHSLALCADGTLTGWGANSSGQLGVGNLANQQVPAIVDTSGALAGRAIVGLASGFSHSLAVCADGAVAAWGSNTSGQLGDGGTASSPFPVLVDQSGLPAGFTPLRISAGYRYSVLSGVPGVAALWGHNLYGQVGDATLQARSLPTALSPDRLLPGDRILAATSGPAADHSLALVAEPIAPRIEEWRLFYFQTPENTGNAADSASPANDGVVNLMKFATGMDPRIAGRPATSARIEGGDLLFSYPRAKAALADGLVFRIESSNNLAAGSWQTLPTVPESVEDLGPIHRITVAIPIINSQRLFLRLRVQSPGF